MENLPYLLGIRIICWFLRDIFYYLLSHILNRDLTPSNNVLLLQVSLDLKSSLPNTPMLTSPMRLSWALGINNYMMKGINLFPEKTMWSQNWDKPFYLHIFICYATLYVGRMLQLELRKQSLLPHEDNLSTHKTVEFRHRDFPTTWANKFEFCGLHLKAN